MMHSVFFCPVLSSASITSLQWCKFTVPWGIVPGWNKYNFPLQAFIWRTKQLQNDPEYNTSIWADRDTTAFILFCNLSRNKCDIVVRMNKQSTLMCAVYTGHKVNKILIDGKNRSLRRGIVHPEPRQVANRCITSLDYIWVKYVAEATSMSLWFSTKHESRTSGDNMQRILINQHNTVRSIPTHLVGRSVCLWKSLTKSSSANSRQPCSYRMKKRRCHFWEQTKRFVNRLLRLKIKQ